jgi:amidase
MGEEEDQMTDLMDLDAIAQAELVHRKEVTALDLVEAAIDRIERLNPQVNAVVLRTYDRAREAAAAPVGDGPLAGVPYLLKDLVVEEAGVPLHEGSAFLSDYVPAVDSELVRRLKRAGLILLGRTNTPEMGLGPTTEPGLYGPARNPWDLTRTTGGSSGGAGAAVACRMVAAAHGNDAGGSIRIPAACCGVFGLKPTRARVPAGPHYGELLGGLAVEHALTRSVRDSAALLDAVAGPDRGDPYWAPPPARPFREEVGRPPGRLRIAFSTRTLLGSPVHPDCVAAVHEAARLCETLGHVVTERAPAVDAEPFWLAFTTVISAAFTWAIDDWSRRIGRAAAPEHFEPFLWALAERGRAFSAAGFLLAQQDIHRASRDVARFFGEHDVWLTPTLGTPPVALGRLVYRGGDPFDMRRRITEFCPFTWVANATGQPAMSVPLHWNAEGLPIGTHWMAPFGDEATLLRLAAQLEAARPWTRRPPICP